MADLSPEAADFARQIEDELAQARAQELALRGSGGGHFYVRVNVPPGRVQPVKARLFREVPVAPGKRER